MAVIIVKDESFLLLDASIFIELWESDVAQSDYLLGHDLTGRGFDRFAGEEVFQDDSVRKAGLFNQTTGSS